MGEGNYETFLRTEDEIYGSKMWEFQDRFWDEMGIYDEMLDALAMEGSMIYTMMRYVFP